MDDFVSQHNPKIGPPAGNDDTWIQLPDRPAGIRSPRLAKRMVAWLSAIVFLHLLVAGTVIAHWFWNAMFKVWPPVGIPKTLLFILLLTFMALCIIAVLFYAAMLASVIWPTRVALGFRGEFLCRRLCCGPFHWTSRWRISDIQTFQIHPMSLRPNADQMLIIESPLRRWVVIKSYPVEILRRIGESLRLHFPQPTEINSSSTVATQPPGLHDLSDLSHLPAQVPDIPAGSKYCVQHSGQSTQITIPAAFSSYDVLWKDPACRAGLEAALITIICDAGLAWACLSLNFTPPRGLPATLGVFTGVGFLIALLIFLSAARQQLSSIDILADAADLKIVTSTLWSRKVLKWRPSEIKAIEIGWQIRDGQFPKLGIRVVAGQRRDYWLKISGSPHEICFIATVLREVLEIPAINTRQDNELDI